MEKTERNKLIVEQIEKGKTFEEVAKMFGLKAKSTVYHIYKRAMLRAGKTVRSYPHAGLASRS